MNATKARVKLLQEHYNLQIHNPNIVLTQKVHNTFLKAKNPHVLCARCPLGERRLRLAQRETFC